MKKRKGPPRNQTVGKGKKQMDEDSWRAELEAISINDDNWWCIVAMMVETTTEHSKCVSLFNTAAEEGRRKAIFCLSYQKMVSSVKMLSKSSLEKCPTIQGVCHYANKLSIDENVRVPVWLVARIIKFLIYRIKEEIIGTVKRMAVLEHEIDEEYRIMQTVADWGQPGSRGFNAEKLNNKAITKLRKRGEEWRDMVYVDDAPLNGPNLYIVLTGFHDPDLPEHLVDVGVPLSFIIRIKRSKKDLDKLAECETLYQFETTKNLPRFGIYSSCVFDLFRFWSKIQTRVMDPESHPALLDVAILLFRPQELPEIYDDDEYERLKKDMYDKVSYFMYDLYDLHRQHKNYLKSMRIEKTVADDGERKCDTKIYGALLDAVPQECVSVPLILFAILAQIDANDREELIEIEGMKTGDSKETSIKTKGKLETASQLNMFVEEKIKALNKKFDYYQMANVDEEPITDIELILREDILNETIRFFDDRAKLLFSEADDMINNILSVLWYPTIMSLHAKQTITRKKLDKYSGHMENIRRYLDTRASNEEVAHYLHILMFDKMISRSTQASNRQTAADSRKEKLEYILNTRRPRSKSVPGVPSRFTERVHFHSDGNIEYGKVPLFFVDCAPLFEIIDPRELLVPGYLEKNLFSLRCKSERGLEDFDDVELLPRSIFMQRVQQCLDKHDSYKIIYFEPTDSVLLCFGNEWGVNGVHEEERMRSIRTPVRFRDFCEYVVAEERDWIREEEQMYRLQTGETLKGLTKKTAEASDQALLFTDEDFILPWSLKAKDLAARTGVSEGADSLSTVNETSQDSKKGKEKKKKFSKKEKQNESKSSANEASSRISKKTPSDHTMQEEASYEFTGYDLGSLRVHVKNRRTLFLLTDGARVTVEIDDWIYKNKDLRITVTIQGYSLYLFNQIDKPKISEMFHLISPLGIVIAFEKLLRSHGEPRHSSGNHWFHRGFDFRASWPSGLLIKPVIGDSEKNPFYIRQSYIKNNCNEEVYEVCRMFLRNGTVLKYLHDGKIIVLRPNGDIVTCISFENIQYNEDEKTNDDTNSAKGDGPGKGSRLPWKGKRRPTSSFKFRLAGVDQGDSARQISRTNNDNVPQMTDAMTKVSRYTVVSYDGRQYEVLDDLLVSEDHRLLVRTASDYEVDEKFTRRGDGTDMLLNSNGELIVGFPDGTRITTGYIVEEEPVTCDWTEEEVARFFVSKTDSMEDEDQEDGSLSNFKFPGESSSELEHGDIDEILIADSFVSVLLTCRMEHKNYATVFYDQSAVSCTLSMPDDLRVSISRRGHYKVSMADGVNLKIGDDGLSFEGNMCATCGSRSTSTYNFFPSELSSVVFTSTDVCGNILEVKDDGRARYRDKSRPPARRKSDHSADAGESSWDEEDGCDEEEAEKDERLEVDAGCDHAKRCAGSVADRCRLFSMNRDLTAYEYHHRSVKQRAEAVAVFDNGTGAIVYPAPRRSKLARLITLETTKPEPRSKAALSFQEFKVRPTNFDRTDLIRSTYAIPYDWLFPFGRNGNGILKNTHDLPLMTDAEKKMPELLETRILYGFKEPGENAVINIQRALGRYWISLVSGTTDPTVKTGSADTQDDVATVFNPLEQDLRDLSLGIKKTIDVTTYRSGLERRLKVPRARTPRKSIEFNELLRQKATKREELEWYKRCFKEKFHLPYFRNITGACFLLVLDCVENASKISLTNCSHREQNGNRLSEGSQERS